MKYSLLTCCVFLLLAPAMAQAADSNRLASVNKVSVVSENPFQLRIETTGPVVPQAQMIEQPDRLVIDLPNTRPGQGLRRINVNRDAVRSVRESLYSTQPPVTRVVVDLTLPQWYRIVPDGSGILVTIGGGASAPSDPGPTIGWVSTKSPAQRVTVAKTTPGVSRGAPSAPRAVLVNGASVEFANGMLTIHATNATLSEILFQVQKKTGAEIAIPAGTEQDRVAADFGPGTPSEVLSQLLNGSGLNFVVVGSEADPKILRSVLLSRKGAEISAPMTAAQPYAPPVAQNVEPEDAGGMPQPSGVAPGPESQQMSDGAMQQQPDAPPSGQ